MRHLLVLAALVGATLSLPTAGPAYAAATCHGFAATIEADTGEVRGTSADDVIVVTGAPTGSVNRVDGGAGDDLICVVGITGQLSLHSGAGNDTIDASTAGSLIFGFLGPGVDTYVGGPQIDQIDASGDPDQVVIRTAGGDDYVAATGGPAIVDTGSGDDVVSYAVPSGGAPSSLELGTGHDWVSVEDAVDVRADLRRHTIRQNGVTTALYHAENIQAAARHVTLTGDSRDNSFIVVGCRMDLFSAGGDDRVVEVADIDGRLPPCHRQRAQMYGGTGSDSLRGFVGDDLLVGGPGRDVAAGAGGWDRCLAEKRLNCER
jgi:Ca2+-binding RTX toxin-like protein